VTAKITIEMESEEEVSMETLETFVNEMDYGFTPTLFSNGLQVMNIEWTDNVFHVLNSKEERWVTRTEDKRGAWYR